MKYQLGDMVLVKSCDFRPHEYSIHKIPPYKRQRPPLSHHNTIGIITAVEYHLDFFKERSSDEDNCYIWYSQLDGKEYSFFENEVDGEIV